MNKIGESVVRGENFLNLADHVLMYYDQPHSAPSNIKDGDVVYCDTRSLYKFKDELMKHKDLVIITHNCIGPVSDETPWRNDGVNTEDFEGCYRYWFAKNCYSKKDNVIPIPLGFENIRWDRNGMKRQTLNNFKDKVPTKTAYLNCKIGTNTSARQLCWDQCKGMGFDLDGPNLPFFQFMDKMGNYKFIISPDGAGVDCHRTWEGLFINRIPVVKNAYPLQRLYENMPVLFVDEWTDLQDMDLDKVYSEMSNTLNRSMLLQDYWDAMIMEKINAN